MSKKYEGTREVNLSYPMISSQVKFLQGKILTVLEASIDDDRKLKAVKDLVNKMVSEQLTRISQLCYPELPMWSREQVAESGVDVDAIERGAVDLSTAPLGE
jgi:hypothetical protein